MHTYGAQSLHVHFGGEPDDGIRPSSQFAIALRAIGVEATLGDAPWRSSEWRRICRDCDIMHLVTYRYQDASLLRRIWWARSAGRPVVRTWVGSDVLWALDHAPSRRLAHQLVDIGVKQMAVAPHLVEELATVGIHPEYHPPLTPQLEAVAPIPPMPECFTILCYLPSRRRTFYGGAIVDALIARRPDWRFVILGDGDTDYSNRLNVTLIAKTSDMAEVLTRTSVLIRPTMHDGTPRMVLEALSLGRQVVTSTPMPHIVIARTVEDYLSALHRWSEHRELNAEGSRWVREVHDPVRTAGTFRTLLEQHIASARRRPRLIHVTNGARFAMRHRDLMKRTVAPIPSADDLPQDAVALRASLG